MIKLKQLGMIKNAKINPVLTSSDAVKLYDFVVEDGVTYLIMNAVAGDDSYRSKVTIPAGGSLNGFNVDAWLNQKLLIDASHIVFGSGESYDAMTVGTVLTVITTGENKGKLEIAEVSPASGAYFTVTKKCHLTGKAVEVVISNADEYLEIIADTDISATFDLLGKVISDLQEDIEIEDDVVSGTLKYVSDYTGFSGDVEEQEGNYLALHIDAIGAVGSTVKVQLVGGVHGEVTLDSDRVIIIRITSTEQKVKITASKTGLEDVVRELKLTGLTLAE